MKYWPVLFGCLCGLLAWPATANAGWADPGWDYVYNANPGEDQCGSVNCPYRLDSTWTRLRSSDQWDGSPPGRWQLVPGGATIVDIGGGNYALRVIDPGDPRDWGAPDPGSNRKFYSGHDLSQEGVDPGTNIVEAGVTIAFRFRQLRLEDVDWYDQTPDGGEGGGGDLDPGYTFQGNGKGPIGVVARSGGTKSLNFTILGGHLLGAGTRDGVAVDVPLCDPNGWVEVWATAQAAEGGIAVKVYLNGSLTPVFDGVVDLPNGSDKFDNGSGGKLTVNNYLFLGLEQTGQFGAFDFDYIGYKAGAYEPTLPPMADVDLRAFGRPIAKITDPMGGGNHDINVIVDFDEPPEGNGDSGRQYDTYHGANVDGPEWIGLDFQGQVHTVKSFTWQEGKHFGDGGAFSAPPVCEARVDGLWTVVQTDSDPPYPVCDFSTSYQQYTFNLDPPVVCDAIRIFGEPWGAWSFTSTGEVKGAAEGFVGQYPTVSISASATTVTYGDEVTFTAEGCDSEGTPLTYSWDLNAADGLGEDATGAEIAAPMLFAGRVNVTCTATDGDGNSVRAQTTVTVLPVFGYFPPAGDPVAGAIQDNGFINAWLLLGPYGNLQGCEPPQADMLMDYLTDGSVSDRWILPYEGMQVATDYSLAYSWGLYGENDPARNPGGVPTWLRWVDNNGHIDYNEVDDPDVDNAMYYAVCYVNYDGDAPLPVNVAGGSDDSLFCMVNDHVAINFTDCRGYGAGSVQNRAETVLLPGLNRVMTKTFEGGGGFNFGIRFEERGTNQPLTEADGLSVYLATSAPQVRVTPTQVSGVLPIEATIEVQATDPDGIEGIYWDLDPSDGLSIDATGGSLTAVFDASTTVTIMVVDNSGAAAMATVPITGAPLESFVDEFDGVDPLDPASAWTAHIPQPCALGYSFNDENPGHLRLFISNAQSFDNWRWRDRGQFGGLGCHDRSPKLLLPVAGDWMIETLYRIPDRQSNNSTDHVGLIAVLREAGEDMSWTISPCPDYLMWGQHRERIRLERNGCFGSCQVSDGTSRDQEMAGIRIRIEKRGNRYEFWAKKSDAEPWKLEWGRDFPPAKYVGLFAKNWQDWMTVDFDYFKLLPAIYPPSDLACAQTSLDGAQGFLLQWQNNSAYESITVKRNGAEIATLAGDVDSFFDLNACAEAFCALTYEVTAVAMGGDWSSSASCSGAYIGPGVLVFQNGVYPDPSYDGTHDAHIIRFRSWDNEWNTGAHDHIEEGDWGGGHNDHKEILVQFDIDQVPAGQEIQSAKLRLFFDYCRSGQWVDHQSYVRKVLKRWNEGSGGGVDGRVAEPGEVTWQSPRRGEESWDLDSAIWEGCDYPENHRGGAFGPSDVADPESISTVYGNVGGRWVDWSVTNMVQEWVNDPSINYGMKVTQNPGNNPCFDYVPGGYDFISRNHGNAGLRPMLVVEMARPVCPADLACEVDGHTVTVSWSNNDAYDNVDVKVDGAVAASTTGETVVLEDVAFGDHDIEVIASLGAKSCPALACSVSVPLLCPTDFACQAADHTVNLSWVNHDTYDALKIFEGATLLATLAGSAQTAALEGVAPGAHTYALVAEADSLSCGTGGTMTCDVTVETDCPDTLDCAVSGDNVTLTWDIDDAYTAIVISRDGTEIATLGGGTSTYEDAGVTPGPHTYSVVAQSANPDCPALECEVSVGIPFKRGDANADGLVDISDGVTILMYAFGAGAEPSCLDAADANDDGGVDGVGDAIYTFNHLFAGGPAPPAPFPDCGLDATPDDGLGCADYPPCEGL